jgi:hypothetical protein
VIVPAKSKENKKRRKQKLAGKFAMVTGGSQGFDGAIAKLLAIRLGKRSD